MLSYSVEHSMFVMILGTSIGFVQKVKFSEKCSKSIDPLKFVMGAAILLIGLYMFWLAFKSNSKAMSEDCSCIIP